MVRRLNARFLPEESLEPGRFTPNTNLKLPAISEEKSLIPVAAQPTKSETHDQRDRRPQQGIPPTIGVIDLTKIMTKTLDTIPITTA